MKTPPVGSYVTFRSGLYDAVMEWYRAVNTGDELEHACNKLMREIYYQRVETLMGLDKMIEDDVESGHKPPSFWSLDQTNWDRQVEMLRSERDELAAEIAEIGSE